MQNTKNRYLFDCEGDSLVPTKFWCLVYYDIDTKEKGELTTHDAIKEFLLGASTLIGHNISRWDIPQLSRVLNIKINAELIDTLGLSWYLEPERKRNGLEAYGDHYGIPKVKINDWENLSLEEYLARCTRDVEINIRLWKDQLQHLQEIYTKPAELNRFLRYMQMKMHQAHLAEKSKWKLDVQRCKSSIEQLEAEREIKTSALAAAMPRVPVVKKYERPKRLRNANGQLSLLGQRWEDRLKSRGLPEGHDGPVEEITSYDDPNPGSSDQIKSWLFSLGWQPQTFKETVNAEGVKKQVPQINKDKQKGGGVCESVLALLDKEPAIDHLDGLGIISHRLSILRGFLRDVDSDGYITASVQGLTNTLRFKHSVVVNLPKPEARYGEHIRSCLIAPEGMELCGADMSGLEDRLKQHFLFKHDPDYVRSLMDPKYDPHLDLAELAGALTPDEVAEYKSGNKLKSTTAIRSIYKNGNYACQYGAGPPRLAVTCGIDLSEARKVHETYWKRNWAIKVISDEQTIKYVREQMWLYNPISRFWYSLRNTKDVFSTLVQGSGVYCFDTWVAHVLADREQLTAQFHDEIVLLVKEGHREEIEAWLKETIAEVNNYLKLNRELDIGVQFGENYSEIH